MGFKKHFLCYCSLHFNVPTKELYISKHLFGLKIFTYLSSTSLLLLGATKSAINQQLYCRHVLSKKGPKMGPHELKLGIKFDLVVFEGVEKYTLMQPY